MKMGIVYAETLPDEYGAYEIVWGIDKGTTEEYLQLREVRKVMISKNGSGPVASRVFGPIQEIWFRRDRLNLPALEVHEDIVGLVV